MGLLSGGFGVKTLLKDKSLWRIRLCFVYVIKAFQIITHKKGPTLLGTHTHKQKCLQFLTLDVYWAGFVDVVVDSDADLDYFITPKQMNMF